jgi:hypothetical protein
MYRCAKERREKSEKGIKGERVERKKEGRKIKANCLKQKAKRRKMNDIKKGRRKSGRSSEE